MRAGQLAKLAVVHLAGSVEGDDVVHLGADTDPFAEFVVVVAGR